METVEEKVDAKADVNLDLVTVEKVDEANALETEEKVAVLVSALNAEAVSETEKKVEADLAIVEKAEEILLLVPSVHAMPT